MTSDKKETIANIYLYLVTLIGLIMIVIPAVDLLKIGLQTWVFPLAGEDEYASYNRLPPEPYPVRDKVGVDTTTEEIGTVRLTQSQIEAVESWQVAYKSWEEQESTKDYGAIALQRDLVRDISTLIVGLALFLSHGSIIRKRKKA